MREEKSLIGEILKYNASTLFLLIPITGEGKDVLNGYNLVRSYLRDKNREDLDGDLLFVLFRPPDFANFEEFLEEQKTININYLEDYDYEGGYVVVVYTIPDSMARDFKKFKQGKYSEFTTSVKKLFKKTVKLNNNKEETTIQWRVFVKENKLRKEIGEYIGEELPEDMELFKSPGKEEILDINEVRNKEKLLKSSI